MTADGAFLICVLIGFIGVLCWHAYDKWGP